MVLSETTENADQWLAACVRAVLAGTELPPWPLTGSAGVELAAVVAPRVEFHGIALLLSDRPLVPLDWPAEVVETVWSISRRAAVEETLRRAAILPLIDGLGAAGVPVMAMKGAALAYLFYDNPAKRPRGDTDLLIHDEHMPQVHALLEQLGWSKVSKLPGLILHEGWDIDCGAGMRHMLDLHRRVSDRPALQKILRDEDYWSNPVPLDRLSPHICAPDPLRMMVHGAVNQVWHEARGFYVEGERIVGGRRLIWAVDYHHLTASFTPADWEALIEFGITTQSGAIIHRALDGAQADVGLSLPEGVLERLLPENERSAALFYIREGDSIRDGIADLRASAGMAARWRLLKELALPPRSALVAKYPRAGHWPTLALVARRFASAAVRLVTGRSPSRR